MEAYLHENIPLSAAMGLRVLAADVDGVTLEAPLEPNLNHRSTAFGGSVSALAILAGWTSVHFRLVGDAHPAHVVIHESAVRYTVPIHDAFRARTGRIPDAEWARFTRTLARRGRARIRIDVAVGTEQGEAATFHASYVALTEAP